MTCENCGSPMKFKSGTKRETGKAWAGNFCENQTCKNVIWVDVVKEPVKFVGQDNKLKVDEKPDWEKIREEKTENISRLNALNNAVLTANAWLGADRINDGEEYKQMVADYMKYYLSLNKNE